MSSMISDNELFARLRNILTQDWIKIPEDHGYGGTGAPGKVLEELLGVNGGNSDTPDAGKWEIKFHSRSSLLTLFHLEGEPKGHMHQMVRKFGRKDDNGRLSFRHTLYQGKSSRGLYIANESNRITVRHRDVSDIVWPYWTHDKIVNAFASKFRRLIVVKGNKKNGYVRYEVAHLYEEPAITMFIEAIEKGIVCIDFDARTKNGRGLRSHGTKFRIKLENLKHLYNSHKKFT